MPSKGRKKAKLTRAEVAEIDSSPRKVSVALRIAGKDLDPEEISARMGLHPTSSAKQGDRSPILVEPCDEGTWQFSSEHLDSRWLTKHFEWLLPQLSARRDVISQLRDEGYRMSVSCYWLAASDNAEAHINTSSMKELVDLGLDFWIDVYLSDGME